MHAFAVLFYIHSGHEGAATLSLKVWKDLLISFNERIEDTLAQLRLKYRILPLSSLYYQYHYLHFHIEIQIQIQVELYGILRPDRQAPPHQ